jgi:Ca2+-binding RTX toxin-like protein
MAIYTGLGTSNDIFVGTSGSDTFTGNRGNDQMTGNGGNDVFVFDRLFDRDIIYDFSEGDRLDFSRFHISDFASLQPFMTQSGADVVIQFTLDDVIERLTLRNTALASLTASDMIFDTSTTLVSRTGGAKADVLFGAGGADVLRGEAGDDRIFGGAAVDRIYGGDGRDILEGGAGNDRIYSGQGGGTMQGGAGTICWSQSLQTSSMQRSTIRSMAVPETMYFGRLTAASAFILSKISNVVTASTSAFSA